jgi:hypothetical protein
VQICPAHAERIPDVLIRTSSVSVKRDGKALNSDACHFHAFLSIDAYPCRKSEELYAQLLINGVTGNVDFEAVKKPKYSVRLSIEREFIESVTCDSG